MTTFSTSQIPSNINTLEKLLAWNVFTLRALNSGVSITEAEGYLQERVVQAPLIETPLHGSRHVFRVCVELEPDYAVSTKKLWENFKEISAGALPAGIYTSN